MHPDTVTSQIWKFMTNWLLPRKHVPHSCNITASKIKMQGTKNPKNPGKLDKTILDTIFVWIWIQNSSQGLGRQLALVWYRIPWMTPREMSPHTHLRDMVCIWRERTFSSNKEYRNRKKRSGPCGGSRWSGWRWCWQRAGGKEILPWLCLLWLFF